MILDILKNYTQYTQLHRYFPQAFDFLLRSDIPDLPEGNYEIAGSDIYAIVSESKGKTVTEAKLESHLNYIDIQYLIRGEEQIGWSPVKQCENLSDPYSAEKDIMFFGDNPSQYLILNPGSFAVFFPEDAHAPMISEAVIKKVIIKIKV